MLSTCLFPGMPFTEKYKLHCCWKNLKDSTKFDFSQHINGSLVLLTIIVNNFSRQYSITNTIVLVIECFSNKLKEKTIMHVGLMSTVFANGPGDRVSILGQVKPKTLKMVLDAVLLNTQHYKVRIKGKVEQSRERSSALPYTSV